MLFSALAVGLFGAAAALAVGGRDEPGADHLVQRGILRAATSGGVIEWSLRHALLALRVVLKPVLLAAAAAALLIAFAWLRTARRAGRPWPLLVALLGYDLGSFGRGYNAIVEPRQIYPRTPAIDFLQRSRGRSGSCSTGGSRS